MKFLFNDDKDRLLAIIELKINLVKLTNLISQLKKSDRVSPFIILILIKHFFFYLQEPQRI